MWRRSPLSTQRDRQKPSSHTWRQMRSALAGTVINVVTDKTAATVPMSVVERMFHLLWVSRTNDPRSHAFLERLGSFNFEMGNTFEFLTEHFCIHLFRKLFSAERGKRLAGRAGRPPNSFYPCRTICHHQIIVMAKIPMKTAM